SRLLMSAPVAELAPQLSQSLRDRHASVLHPIYVDVERGLQMSDHLPIQLDRDEQRRPRMTVSAHRCSSSPVSQSSARASRRAASTFEASTTAARSAKNAQ